MNLAELEVQELTQIEVVEMSGGTFGHDAGVSLRFLWIQATQGTDAAIGDYVANKIVCGC